MACIMAVYNDKGRCISLCSARCYNAKPPSEWRKDDYHQPCCCVCGGANHAVGEIRALKNYQLGVGFRPDDLAAFAKRRGLDPKKLVVIDRLRTPQDRAKKAALARLKPVKPRRGELFAYGLMGNPNLLPVEGARQRRG
jgi:hypothetical protein